MTLLRKTIRRETPIIVSIEPGDVIGFREKGRRKTFRLPVKTCFLLAVKAEVNDELRRKHLGKIIRVKRGKK